MDKLCWNLATLMYPSIEDWLVLSFYHRLKSESPVNLLNNKVHLEHYSYPCHDAKLCFWCHQKPLQLESTTSSNKLHLLMKVLMGQVNGVSSCVCFDDTFEEGGLCLVTVLFLSSSLDFCDVVTPPSPPPSVTANSPLLSTCLTANTALNTFSGDYQQVSDFQMRVHCFWEMLTLIAWFGLLPPFSTIMIYVVLGIYLMINYIYYYLSKE